MAKLYFRYGAMNSGKSTLLLQTCYNYQENNMKAIIVKRSIDTKGNNTITSRIGVSKEVDLLLKDDDDIYEIVKKKFRKVNCVLVDEAQFLSRKQVDECMKIVTDLDIPVICYGLRTDFLTNGFEGSTRLLQIAHTIEEMKTICKCGRKAIYNARYKDGKMITKGSQVAIDGEKNVTYVSMCAKCYEKEKNKIDKK